MGLIYSSSDSEVIKSSLATNLSIARTAISNLNSGSQQLIAAIDGQTLAGVAYTAGKGLFSELVIPTIKRVSSAVDNVQRDLNTFSSADSFIASEGYLEEDNLNEQLTLCKSSKTALENAERTANMIANALPEPLLSEMIRGMQRDFARRAQDCQKDIQRIEKKLNKLREFNGKTSGLFQESLAEFKLAMQGIMVLNGTTIHADGSYTLPSGVDKSWFDQIKPKAKEQIATNNSNAFLELYTQVKQLMNPLTSGKTDNMKRMEQLLAMYPKALVDKLMKNDEFWMLANKLPSKVRIKLISGLEKYKAFGQAIAHGKWIPKIDTLGKGYQWFSKMTNPIKTYVSESLKHSKFVQSAKSWGVAKGLGTAAQVATYVQLGVTFVSSTVNEYGKTGSIGKGVIGGAIDTVKSIGPLEGATLGAAIGTAIPVVGNVAGAVIGFGLGMLNKGVQFRWPSGYDNFKNSIYDVYDKSTKDIGKAVEQKVDTVKHVYRDIQQVGKSIGKTLSSVEIPKVSFNG